MPKPVKSKTQKPVVAQKFKGMTMKHGAKKSGSKKSCNCGH